MTLSWLQKGLWDASLHVVLKAPIDTIVPSEKTKSMGSEKASISYLTHFVLEVMSEKERLGNYERRKTLFHIRQIFKHGQWRNLQSTLELCPYPELPTVTIADSYCALGFAVTAFTLCILSFTSLVLLFNFWKTKKNAHFFRPPGKYILLSSISKKPWCLSLYMSLLVQVIVVTWHSSVSVGFLLGADTSQWFLPPSHVAGGMPVKLCAKERAVEKHAVGPRMEWGVTRVQEPGFPRERQKESKQKEKTGLNRLPRQGPFWYKNSLKLHKALGEKGARG